MVVSTLALNQKTHEMGTAIPLCNCAYPCPSYPSMNSKKITIRVVLFPRIRFHDKLRIYTFEVIGYLSIQSISNIALIII